MSSQLVIAIDDPSKPTNIPDCETIVKLSFKLRRQQKTAVNNSGARIDLPTESAHDVSQIWVKFGHSILDVGMGEAHTQQYVAQYLRKNDIPSVRAPAVYLAFVWDNYGFIVSEFIDGPMCDVSDTRSIAAAVQTLIAIPNPGLSIGCVGGGLMENPIFYERRAYVEYESVVDLQDHINGILRVTERPGRVDFSREGNICLCPSDLEYANFMRDCEGKIVAVDFSGYSFLPPSFVGMALEMGSPLAHNLKRYLDIPDFPHENLSALRWATNVTVPYGTNNIGLPKRLKGKVIWPPNWQAAA